ncbi:hypothetical protein NDU88_005523 [Pleurodeles waltl]|uniref:Uncharacterized protein n=1 Tax=Pleurodeles waltl TaxID=8319 RepID=A0AAV7MA80_PLEWA|nr:hypothetical protein NDU88_005523 [Pleurodeles waltl]
MARRLPPGEPPWDSRSEHAKLTTRQVPGNWTSALLCQAHKCREGSGCAVSFRAHTHNPSLAASSHLWDWLAGAFAAHLTAVSLAAQETNRPVLSVPGRSRKRGRLHAEEPPVRSPGSRVPHPPAPGLRPTGQEPRPGQLPVLERHGLCSLHRRVGVSIQRNPWKD